MCARMCMCMHVCVRHVHVYACVCARMCMRMHVRHISGGQYMWERQAFIREEWVCECGRERE